MVIYDENSKVLVIPGGETNVEGFLPPKMEEYTGGLGVMVNNDLKTITLDTGYVREMFKDRPNEDEVISIVDAMTSDLVSDVELDEVLEEYITENELKEKGYTTEEDVVNLIDAQTGDYIDADELAAVLDDYALKTSLDGKVDKDNYLYKALLDNAAKWNKAAFAITNTTATLNLYKFDGSYSSGVAAIGPATTEKAGLMSTAMFEQLNNAASKEYVDSIVGVINNQLESI